MYSRSKRFAIAAGLVALPLGLAACGGSSDGSEAGGGDTLTLWHYETPESAMGVAWAEAVEVFEEEHPGVTVEVEQKAFEQIQQTAGQVLSSTEGPDIMEYNKGNATAGLLASQGLLAPLTDAAAEHGWDQTLPESLQTTARYDERGVMGSGDWYGVPNYGEFVGLYYNQDMLDAKSLAVPTTLGELESAMDAFVDDGVTPTCTAGAEYPAMQIWYQLTLAEAGRDWVNAYQMYTDGVDFQGPETTSGAETFADWIEKGYIADDAAGLKAEDMGVSFINGSCPFMVSGSWWYGRLVNDITSFEWGMTGFPGNDLTAGSSGNLWVIPANSENPELAEDFIDITLRPEIQALLGNNGGLPVAADPADITDPKSQELISVWNAQLDGDALAFYPDWPVPGYYDVLVGGFQSLINQSKTPQEVLDEIAGPYQDGVADIVG
jgi:raffinose/stachyose/melibiose transport system substrate-binding protein